MAGMEIQHVRIERLFQQTLLAVMLIVSSGGVSSADEAAGGGRGAALPYYNRANRYLAQGRFDDAKRDLLEAIKLYPDEPDFHTNLGIAYRKLDQYSDAEREFKIAIAYNRDDWMNWSNLANAYLKQDMLEKTIATFEETLKHKPPVSEQAAIKQDIADIKKVLAVRQGAVPPGASPLGASSATIIKKTNSTKGQTLGVQQKISGVSHGSSVASRTASKKVPELDLPSQKVQTGQESKKSDWGYDLK